MAAPVRKCHDKRAEQPVATADQRLPHPTDPSILVCLKWLSIDAPRALRRASECGAGADARAQLAEWAQGENPCAVYPADDEVWNAHDLYHESDTFKRAGFIAAAGGRVDAFYFSGCWDPLGVALLVRQNGNMVAVVRRGEAAIL